MIAALLYPTVIVSATQTIITIWRWTKHGTPHASSSALRLEVCGVALLDRSTALSQHGEEWYIIQSDAVRFLSIVERPS